MSEAESDDFEQPAHLQDLDLYPYDTVHFSQLDLAVQLQWALELKNSVAGKIERVKSALSLTQEEKTEKVNDLYEMFYIHRAAARHIAAAIANVTTHFNGIIH